MKAIRYTDAVPPVPDHFKRAMRRALDELEPAKNRQKMPLALAIALAVMLALSGIAYAAAQFGILDLIFTARAPGDDAGQIVRHVGASTKGKYADFTVHDYIFNGSELYANWTLQMHTDERLVLISTGMAADFQQDDYCDQGDPGSMAVNNAFTDTFPDGSWSSMNRGYFYDKVPDEPFEVSMDLALVRPNPNAAMVRFTEECAYRDQPVWLYDDESVSWSYGYYCGDFGNGPEIGSDDIKVSDKLDARADEVGYHQAWLEHFEEFGYGEVIEQLSVSFTIVPENYPVMGLDEPQTFELQEYSLTVNHAEFNGFSAEINLTLELPESRENFMPRFSVLADGKPVELAAQMDASSKSLICNYDLWSEGGCALLPDILTLIENDTGERIRINLTEN